MSLMSYDEETLNSLHNLKSWLVDTHRDLTDTGDIMEPPAAPPAEAPHLAAGRTGRRRRRWWASDKEAEAESRQARGVPSRPARVAGP